MIPSREIVDAFRLLDIELANKQGATTESLAGCHLGLGIVMLRELHWPVDKILALVAEVASEHVPS